MGLFTIRDSVLFCISGFAPSQRVRVKILITIEPAFDVIKCWASSPTMKYGASRPTWILIGEVFIGTTFDYKSTSKKLLTKKKGLQGRKVRV